MKSARRYMIFFIVVAMLSCRMHVAAGGGATCDAYRLRELSSLTRDMEALTVARSGRLTGVEEDAHQPRLWHKKLQALFEKNGYAVDHDAGGCRMPWETPNARTWRIDGRSSATSDADIL